MKNESRFIVEWRSTSGPDFIDQISEQWFKRDGRYKRDKRIKLNLYGNKPYQMRTQFFLVALPSGCADKRWISGHHVAVLQDLFKPSRY